MPNADLEMAATDRLDLADHSGARPAAKAGGRWLVTASWLVPGLAMLVVGLFRAGEPTLGWDEYATADIAQRTVPQILDVTGWMDASIAPYYLFMHAWTSVFGLSELALRLPSIIGMAVGVGVLGELGRRLFTPYVGLVGGLFLVAAPATSRYAQEARVYGLVFMLVAVATLLLYAAVERPSRWRWVGYGVIMLMAGLLHMFALVALLGHGYVVLSRCWRTERRNVYGWLIATALACLGCAPLILIGLAQRSRQLGWIPEATATTVRTAPRDLAGAEGLAWLLLGLAVVAIYHRRRSTVELAVLAVVPPVLLLAISLLAEPVWVPRYVLYVLGPLALLAAVALDASPGRVGPWVRAGVLLLMITWFVLPTQLGYRSATGHSPDWRWVDSVLSSGQQAGDGIVYGPPKAPWHRAWTEYYLRDNPTRPKDLLAAESAAEAGRLTPTLCVDEAACVGDTRRVWLVKLNEPGVSASADPLDDTGDVAAVLRDGYRVAQSWRNGRMVVVLFEKS